MFDMKVLDEVSTLFGLPETTNNLSSWQYVLHSVVRGTHATFGIFFSQMSYCAIPTLLLRTRLLSVMEDLA